MVDKFWFCGDSISEIDYFAKRVDNNWSTNYKFFQKIIINSKKVVSPLEMSLFHSDFIIHLFKDLFIKFNPELIKNT